MRAINWNKIAGAARAFLPVLCTLLVGWKVLPADIANQIPDAVYNAIVATGGITVIIASAWSYFSNKASEVAKQAASVPGTVVVVAPDAPKDIKAVAADPKHPGVVASAAYIPEPPAGAG
jgi:hypothetical protein